MNEWMQWMDEWKKEWIKEGREEGNTREGFDFRPLMRSCVSHCCPSVINYLRSVFSISKETHWVSVTVIIRLFCCWQCCAPFWCHVTSVTFRFVKKSIRFSTWHWIDAILFCFRCARSVAYSVMLYPTPADGTVQ